MAKFNYKKWVTQNKHNLKLNEQNAPTQQVQCGAAYPGACHTWKECINGNASGNSLVFFDINANLSPAQMWMMLGAPNSGDAILTNTGVKLIYTGLGGDSIDLYQFTFPMLFGGQQSGFGTTPTGATPTQCDFGWRCHWKATPQDMGMMIEWAPHYACIKGTATNPGPFVTKRQCLDSGCLRQDDSGDRPADEFDDSQFNPIKRPPSDDYDQRLER